MVVPPDWFKKKSAILEKEAKVKGAQDVGLHDVMLNLEATDLKPVALKSHRAAHVYRAESAPIVFTIFGKEVQLHNDHREPIGGQ